LSDTVVIIALGVISVCFGVGWWHSASYSRKMARIHIAQVKGLTYTVTGVDPDDPENEAPRSW